MPEPSAYDNFFFPVARQFIEDNVNGALSALPAGVRILDVGSQGKDMQRTYPDDAELLSFDIDPASEADFLGDICESNSDTIPDASFDAILLTDVLEHVCQPFAAIDEVARMLKPRGSVLFSSPLNCRIHGPIPDCWRFTEFGLQVLFRNFDCAVFEKLESPDRTLFPLQYFGVWKKPEEARDIAINELRFERIE